MLLFIAASQLFCDGSKNYARMQTKNKPHQKLPLGTRVSDKAAVCRSCIYQSAKKNSHKLNVLVTLSRIIRETTVNEMCGYPVQNA